MCCRSKKKNTKTLEVIQNETKVVFIGESAVGKSSLLLRFHRNEFSDAFEVTIGGSFIQTKVDLEKGVSMILDVWDTAGSERFRSLMPLYYRQAKAAGIVYDVAKMNTFQECEYWVTKLKEHEPRCILFLVGNKSDQEYREVTRENAEEFARKHNMTAIETSAKSGKNVNVLFAQIAETILKNKKK